MGIFDELKATANAVGKIASGAVDISKLKITAAELSSEISDKYEDLGKTIYEAKRIENCDNSVLVNKIAQLDGLIRQLNDVEDQIAVLKNKLKCEECGYNNDNKALYCMKCGAKLPSQENRCCCSQSEYASGNVSCSNEACNCTAEKNENTTIETCDCQTTGDKSNCDDSCTCGCQDLDPDKNGGTSAEDCDCKTTGDKSNCKDDCNCGCQNITDEESKK